MATTVHLAPLDLLQREQPYAMLDVECGKRVKWRVDPWVTCLDCLAALGMDH